MTGPKTARNTGQNTGQNTGRAGTRLRADARLGAAAVTTLFLTLFLTGCLPATSQLPPPATQLPPAATPALSEAAPSPATLGPSDSAGVTAAAIQSVHFTAQGDIGVGKDAKRVLDTIAGLKPQLNLALGDFTYQAGIEKEFCAMVTDKLGADFPYELVTGNHESDGHDGDIRNFVQCLPNRLPGLTGEYGTQWYVDVPEQKPLVRIIMLSPGIKFHDGNVLDYSKNSPRWRWTAAAVDGAESRKIPWTVVGMHTPCLSIGKYDCLAGEDLTNMLMEKKVDLVLSGHNHSYQRTHQLSLGDRCTALVPGSFSEACITDSDEAMVKGAGTVFATSGLGGAGLHQVKEDDSEIRFFAAWSGQNRRAAFGTLDVTATPDRLDAAFVPAEGSSFRDSFAIEKK